MPAPMLKWAALPLALALALGTPLSSSLLAAEQAVEAEEAEEDEEETEGESLFDQILLKSGSAPDAKYCPDNRLPSMSAAEEPWRNPSQTSPPPVDPRSSLLSVPSLVAGQGALTYQQNVPAIMGDFFGAGAIRMSVVGSVGATSQAVDYIQGTQFFLSSSDIATQTFQFHPTYGIATPPGGTLAIPPVSVVAHPLLTWDNITLLQTPSLGVDGLGRSIPMIAPTDPALIKAVTADYKNGYLLGQPPSGWNGYVVARDASASLVQQGAHPPDPPTDYAIQTDDRYSLTIPFVAIPIYEINLPAGAMSGIVKLAENSSPLPRDRLFMNYNMFDNVALTANGVTVNRFTPGWEKTFRDGRMSVELRVPFATTLDSNILTDGPATDGGLGQLSGLTNTSAAQFGNVTSTWKSYIYQGDTFSLTGGLGLALPTAPNVAVSNNGSTQVLQIRNQAVHLMPFVGSVYTPNSRFFAQSIVQLDTPANGQPTLVNVDPNQIFGPSRLQQAGVYTDPTYIYADVNAGVWLYNNYTADALVTGVAAMGELHYNRSLNQTDQISVPIGIGGIATEPNYKIAEMNIGQRTNIEQLNAVIGATVELRRVANLQFGYSVPLAGQRVFDGEFRLNYSYRFGSGATGRPNRVQFQ